MRGAVRGLGQGECVRQHGLAEGVARPRASTHDGCAVDCRQKMANQGASDTFVKDHRGGGR